MTVTVKRLAALLVVLFLAYYVATSPTTASAGLEKLFSAVGHGLKVGADALISLLNGLIK